MIFQPSTKELLAESLKEQKLPHGEYHQDEEVDMCWAEQQLALIDLIGKQNWLVKQI